MGSCPPRDDSPVGETGKYINTQVALWCCKGNRRNKYKEQLQLEEGATNSSWSMGIRENEGRLPVGGDN